MDVEVVILRILHIGFGVFWVGSAPFLVSILEPRLRALGPAIQRPVMGALARVMDPAMGISGLITIAAGLTLYFRLPRGGFDRLFDDAWSWAIFIGFLATIVAYGFGIGLGGHVSAPVRPGQRHPRPRAEPGRDGAAPASLRPGDDVWAHRCRPAAHRRRRHGICAIRIGPNRPTPIILYKRNATA